MKPCNNIAKLDVQNTLLSHDLHSTWACYVRINITQDQLEHQTAAREQFFNERLYRVVMERVSLVNICRVRTSFVANQQGASEVPLSLHCDYSGLANCPKICFLDVLGRWLFAF